MTRVRHGLIVGGSAVLAALFLGAMKSVFEPSDRIYQFFFCRSFVQYAIVHVFALVTVLTAIRIAGHVRDRRALRNAAAGPWAWRSGNSPITRDLQAVERTLGGHGAAAAAACAARAIEARREQTRKAHELINFLVCAFPALGLFGTMLGLSNSLFAAFSGSTIGQAAVQQFVTALSTALDTTILGIVCAMSAGAAVWALERAESALTDEHAAFLQRTFSLEDPEPTVGGGGAPTSTTATAATDPSALRAELRAMMAQVAADAKASYAALLTDLTESYKSSLARLVAGALAEGQDRETALVEAIGNSVAEAVKTIGTILRDQNGALAKEIAQQIDELGRQLTKGMICVPEEVVIRYPQNGHGHPQAHEVEYATN
jgi:biopolymer transport protein ExbB/TolQ